MSSLFHRSHRVGVFGATTSERRGRGGQRGRGGGGSVHGRDEVLMRAQWRRRRLGRGASLNDALAVALVVLLRAQRAAAADLHFNLLQSVTTNPIYTLPILILYSEYIELQYVSK